LGCRFYGQGKGSHEHWYNPTTDTVFTLAFHAGKPVREGTLRGVLIDAGIDEKEFLKLTGKR
jgi:predicted RNA binding protein YcfA (HicA-like mRNA interferase family)